MFGCEQLHFERLNTVIDQKYKPNWFMHTSDHAGLDWQRETGHQSGDKMIISKAEHYEPHD